MLLGVAAALAGNDGSMYVELGVEHLSSELAAELMTAETLLRDGGVYETIRSAWLAATRL